MTIVAEEFLKMGLNEILISLSLKKKKPVFGDIKFPNFKLLNGEIIYKEYESTPIFGFHFFNPASKENGQIKYPICVIYNNNYKYLELEKYNYFYITESDINNSRYQIRNHKIKNILK